MYGDILWDYYEGNNYLYFRMGLIKNYTDNENKVFSYLFVRKKVVSIFYYLKIKQNAI